MKRDVLVSVVVCCLITFAGCLEDGGTHGNQDASTVTSMTFKEFMDDFDTSRDDENLIASVHLKSFDEGDTVIIEDQLTNLIYNPSVDTTSMTFASYQRLDAMAVEGDITDEFSVGDTVVITSEIVNYSYTYQWEGRNYTVYYEWFADGWDTDKETEVPLPREVLKHADQ
ncbi:MAG: hypothetical protein PHU95_04055 [Candidatus Thermoplasmatota archaeon]|nr:hypothetical protein [Candidatus Thermoplasmatota archaeon]MDD5778603.1 hypothetical protein [Candidatus Thermoplasmatota archaeon]